MKVLVTGANGFVGTAIVAELIKNKYEVISLFSPRTKKRKEFFKKYYCDITKLESFDELKEIGNVDIIIHSAGLAHQFGKTSEKLFWQPNVEGTRNIANLGVALRAKHFILISSVSVYENVERKNYPIPEDSKCEPVSGYARSKLESEKAATEICENNGIALTILRLATVIGENDPGNTSRLIKAIAKGRFLWIGKGENRKSLIYKEDVARACLKILDKTKLEPEIFNVTAEPVKMSYIVSEISKNLKKNVPKLMVPVTSLKRVFKINNKIGKLSKIANLEKNVEKWISEDAFSGEKFANVYGFKAETTISEAIRRQVEAFQISQKRREE